MDLTTSPAVETIDLLGARLEGHVKESLHIALQLAESRPISARDWLESAARIARDSGSAAFGKLAELLPPRPATLRTLDVHRELKMAAVPVTPALAESFRIAAPFCLDEKGIWGRDYVTIGLLANDETLDDLAAGAGTTVAALRDNWLTYASADARRRAPVAWRQWWDAARWAQVEGSSGTMQSLDPDAFHLSNGVIGILQNAAAKYRVDGPLSTTAVLREMLEQGTRRPDPEWAADFLRSELPVYDGGRGTAPSVSPEGVLPAPMTPGLAWCLNHAQELAQQTTSTRKISGRHLLAALLSRPASHDDLGSVRLIVDMGVDIPLLQQRLYEWLRGFGDNDSAWRIALISQSAQPLRRADFDADSARGPDWLNIEQDVLALATLIAARDTTPPLSIGLFGDWGSGKTFFMGQLRTAVGRLAKQSRDAKAMQRELPFYKHIVQIEFNAWHYVEGNLWASIVEHIIGNLHVADDPDSTLTEKLQRRWLKELGFVEAAKASADQTQSEAAERVVAAEKEVAAAQTKHDAKKLELQELSRRSVARDFKLSGALPVVQNALDSLGLRPLSDAASELQSSLREARSVLESGSTSLTALLRANDRKDRWRSLVIILVGAPVLAFVVGALMQKLGHGQIAQISAWATGAAGLLGAGARWVRQQAQWMSQQLSSLEKAQRAYDEDLRQALAETADEKAKTEQDLALARQDYLLAQQRAEQARTQVDAARADVAAATTSRLLGQFIQDRASSTDYRKHLGVLAVVRQDFQQLSRLIEEENWRLAPNSNDDERFGRLKKVASFEEEAADAATRINRIVLYIDDLDRCPPAKVVDVLQAVHLLLAFPLFVVVVGVDARWIARSLETRYRELLHVGDRDGQQDFAQQFGVARSEDYLEKIFQIPLWLRPMDAAAARRMVFGLLGQVNEEQADSVAQGGQQSPVKPPTAIVGDQVVINSSGASMRASATAAPPSPTHVPTGDQMTADSKDTVTNASAEGLLIRDFELAVIDVLAPLLGRSPRTLKRFVNVYRLIKAGLTSTELAAFLRHTDKRLGDYSAVLFLLAVDTGLPRTSRALFDVLLGYARDESEKEVGADQLIIDVERKVSGANTDWIKLKAWMTTFHYRFDPRSILRLIAWAPRTSRYSFQTSPPETGADFMPRPQPREAPQP